jgi:hypothetical protein
MLHIDVDDDVSITRASREIFRAALGRLGSDKRMAKQFAYGVRWTKLRTPAARRGYYRLAL